MNAVMNAVVSIPYLALVVVTLISYTIHIVGSRKFEDIRDKSFLKDIVVPTFTYISYPLIFVLMMTPFVAHAMSYSSSGELFSKFAATHVLSLLLPFFSKTYEIMHLGLLEEIKEYDNSGGLLDATFFTLASGVFAFVSFFVLLAT